LGVGPAISGPLAAYLSRKKYALAMLEKIAQANKAAVSGNNTNSNTGYFDTSIKTCIQFIGTAQKNKTWLGRLHKLLLHQVIQFCFAPLRKHRP